MSLFTQYQIWSPFESSAVRGKSFITLTQGILCIEGASYWRPCPGVYFINILHVCNLLLLLKKVVAFWKHRIVACMQWIVQVIWLGLLVTLIKHSTDVTYCCCIKSCSILKTLYGSLHAKGGTGYFDRSISFTHKTFSCVTYCYRKISQGILKTLNGGLHAKDGAAYFAWAVSYTCKTFYRCNLLLLHKKL